MAQELNDALDRLERRYLLGEWRQVAGERRYHAPDPDVVRLVGAYRRACAHQARQAKALTTLIAAGMRLKFQLAALGLRRRDLPEFDPHIDFLGGALGHARGLMAGDGETGEGAV